jgi:hypothetical protein
MDAVPIEYHSIVTQVPEIERGLIISDMKGNGAYQKRVRPPFLKGKIVPYCADLHGRGAFQK